MTLHATFWLIFVPNVSGARAHRLDHVSYCMQMPLPVSAAIVVVNFCQGVVDKLLESPPPGGVVVCIPLSQGCLAKGVLPMVFLGEVSHISQHGAQFTA